MRRSRSSMPPLAWGLAPMRRVALRAPARPAPASGGPARRTAPRAGSCAASPPAAAGAPDASAGSDSGTWCDAKGALDLQAVDHLRARSSPWASRSTIIGQRGRARLPPLRARCCWMRLDLLDRRVERRGHRLVHQRRARALRRSRASSRSRAAAAPAPRGDAREHRRIGDLVAVQVQDRQHRAVGDRIRGICWSARPWPAARSPPRRRR